MSDEREALDWVNYTQKLWRAQGLSPEIIIYAMAQMGAAYCIGARITPAELFAKVAQQMERYASLYERARKNQA